MVFTEWSIKKNKEKEIEHVKAKRFLKRVFKLASYTENKQSQGGIVIQCIKLVLQTNFKWP